jgi:hypothetical protein
MENGIYLKDGKIDTSEEGIAYWAERLNCSNENLKDAIYKIGTIYNVLEMYLEMNNQIKND